MTAPAKPNAELAYRVLDHIDAHPEQWRQGNWYSTSECGTTACFAGWTVLLSGAKVNEDNALVTDGPAELVGLDVAQAADKLLGISTKALVERDLDDPYDGLLMRLDLGRLVAEIFGPRPGGTGCHCDWLGEGTPEHAPSPLCRSLRPDADRYAPGLIEGDTADEQRDNAYARYEADEAVIVVGHGPVKPPYGSSERAIWDARSES